MSADRGTRVTVLALGGAALLLAGCSGTSSSAAPSSAAPSSAAASSSAAAPSSSAASGAPSSSAASSPTASPTTAAPLPLPAGVLLSAGDVAPGFVPVAAQDGAESAETAQPCALVDPSLPRPAPPAARGAERLADAAVDAAVSETVLVYPTAADAARAWTQDTAGFGCPSGVVRVDGRDRAVNVSAPTTLTRSVGVPVDACRSWQLTASGLHVTVVVAQTRGSVVRLAFEAGAGSDGAALPDARTITRTAIGRLGG